MMPSTLSFRPKRFRALWPALPIGALGMLAYHTAQAHCDTLDGPVVKSAQVALARGNVEPALRWVRAEDEPEIRAVFKMAMAVRRNSPESRKLAERYFFETLVRVHRTGEGETYTGLKPAGTPIPESIRQVDRSLETGSVDALSKSLAAKVGNGVRTRFERAKGLKKGADESVAEGREYVEAYVRLMHYVEKLDEAADGSAAHGMHGEHLK